MLIKIRQFTMIYWDNKISQVEWVVGAAKAAEEASGVMVRMPSNSWAKHVSLLPLQWLPLRRRKFYIIEWEKQVKGVEAVNRMSSLWMQTSPRGRVEKNWNTIEKEIPSSSEILGTNGNRKLWGNILSFRSRCWYHIYLKFIYLR